MTLADLADLQGDRARTGLHRLPLPRRLRHGSAQLGRPDRRPDPRHAGAFRPDRPRAGDRRLTHLFLEASRLAFADRDLYMADSDFVDMPTRGLLDRDYLASRALIDPKEAMREATRRRPPWDDAEPLSPDRPRPRQGTTHFVIVDRYGDMVSATTTIETDFGSRVMTGGFLLNNELTDFALEPEADGAPVPNRVEGGKRPRSSMAPTMVLRDGAPVLLTGSPGGANIIPFVSVDDRDPRLGTGSARGDRLAARGQPQRPHHRRGGARGGGDHRGADRARSRGRPPTSTPASMSSRSGPVLSGAADKRREGMVLGE